MLHPVRRTVAAISAAFLAGVFTLAPAPGSAARPAYFTATQAAAGARVYEAHCAACHGARLQGGGTVPPLRADAIASSETIGGFYRFMIETMPAGRPGSLRGTEYASVMAFLLRESGFRAGAAPLTGGAALKIRARYGSHRR